MEDDIFSLPPQKCFDAIGNDASSWLTTSDSLLASAEILYKHIGEPPKPPNTPEDVWEWFRVHDVARMLRGMAVECLLKAIWIKSGGILAKDGKYKTIPGTKNHDLYSTVIKVSEKRPLHLNDEELKLLSRLSFSIISGRYPIQKSFSGSYPSSPNDSDIIRWNKWEYPKDENIFQTIAKKMKNILYSD